MLNALAKLTQSKSGQQAFLADPPHGPKEPWFIPKPPDLPARHQTAKDGSGTVEATGEDTDGIELRRRT